MLLFRVNVTVHPLSAWIQGIFLVVSGSDSDSDDIFAKSLFEDFDFET